MHSLTQHNRLSSGLAGINPLLSTTRHSNNTQYIPREYPVTEWCSLRISCNHNSSWITSLLHDVQYPYRTDAVLSIPRTSTLNLNHQTAWSEALPAQCIHRTTQLRSPFQSLAPRLRVAITLSSLLRVLQPQY